MSVTLLNLSHNNHQQRIFWFGQLVRVDWGGLRTCPQLDSLGQGQESCRAIPDAPGAFLVTFGLKKGTFLIVTRLHVSHTF